jgi:hypothetical protein
MKRDPYPDMSNEQVLARATKAFSRASELPPRSVERAIQWAVFDSAMAELDRWIVRHVLRKLGKD